MWEDIDIDVSVSLSGGSSGFDGSFGASEDARIRAETAACSLLLLVAMIQGLGL